MQILKELFSVNLITVLILFVVAMALSWNHWLFWLLGAVSIMLMSAVTVFVVGLTLQGKITGGLTLRQALHELGSEAKQILFGSRA